MRTPLAAPGSRRIVTYYGAPPGHGRRRLGDALPNDPNPCAPILHPLNDPLPGTKYLPWLILGASVLGVVLAARKGGR